MTTNAELAEAVKACYAESDGITVWMTGELAQALYAHLTAQPAASAVVEPLTVEIRIPEFLDRSKSDKLVDAVCAAITKHDINFKKVKLVHPMPTTPPEGPQP